jgi:hypothetical protein
MDAAVAAFKRDGYAVLDAAQLSEATVTALVRGLQPWADTQMAPNGSPLAPPWTPGSTVDRWSRELKNYWESSTRLAASNAVLQLAAHGDTAELTLDYMLHPTLLEFAERAFHTRATQIDSIQIACYPRVGEGGNEGHPPTAPSANAELQGWHRDTGNWHNKLRQFHLANGSSAPARAVGPSAGGSAVDQSGTTAAAAAAAAQSAQGLRYAFDPVPDAINFMTYLQESELRVIPGTHAGENSHKKRPFFFNFL